MEIEEVIREEVIREEIIEIRPAAILTCPAGSCTTSGTARAINPTDLGRSG